LTRILYFLVLRFYARKLNVSSNNVNVFVILTKYPWTTQTFNLWYDSFDESYTLHNSYCRVYDPLLNMKWLLILVLQESICYVGSAKTMSLLFVVISTHAYYFRHSFGRNIDMWIQMSKPLTLKGMFIVTYVYLSIRT